MKIIGEFVLVRTDRAGVHFGTLAEFSGRCVVLTRAGRIWNWQGRNTLHEIALRGVGRGSKVSEPVAEIYLLDAIEVIPCTPEARSNLEAAKWSA